ncbi:MAG: UDP-N-acetylglucosamine 2-epimerase [Infirmifilum sp.]
MHILVWTGQHYSYEMSKVFFEELRLPEPYIYLDTPTNGELLDRLLYMVIKLKGNNKKHA